MTGPARRFRKLLATSLGSLLEPAADPRQSPPAADTRQDLLLTQVRQALLNVSSTRRRFAEQVAAGHVLAQQLRDQAVASLNAGQENLARPALSRRALVIEEIVALELHATELGVEENRLALLEQRLRTEIETLRARQEIAAARQTAASAQVRIGEALYGVSDELTDAALALDRNEQETMAMQARADAITELADRGTLSLFDPLLRGTVAPLKGQQALDSEVDAQLEALRRELDASA
jgi:phage shock protein A